jgi:ubiquinone biosynthesis protein UbiJ
MLLERAEQFLNRCVGESTRAQECRDRLRGRSLGIAIDGMPFGVTLSVDGDVLRVTQGVSDAVDVRVEAGLIEAFGLLEADSIAALRRANARIQGDLRVADEYSELLRHAKPDIEGELARYIGDIAAHALAGLARSTARWSAGAGRAWEQNLADYLKAETRLVPEPMEVARFGREVERTRDDVARLEQRLARIARIMAQRGP